MPWTANRVRIQVLMEGERLDDFELELKNGFLVEAGQLLDEAVQCFLDLENNPGDQSILEKIFRIAHNIKGSSKAVGFDELGAFTHEFESFLLKCKSGEVHISEASISLLLRSSDHIRLWIDRLKQDHSTKIDNQQLIDELHSYVQKKGEDSDHAGESAPVQEVEPQISEVPEASRFIEEAEAPTDSESAVISEVSEKKEEESVVSELSKEPVSSESSRSMIESTQSVETPKVIESSKVSATPTQDQANESIRVNLSRLDRLLNFVGELVVIQTVLREQAYKTQSPPLRKTIHQLGKVTKEVQDLSMSLRMVPLKQTFQKMQRIVRDTSNVLKKKVQLTLQGEETEVDKTVLEALTDPLVHLIRNAVDHGIETSEERISKGKPEVGSVILKAFHQGGKLIIQVVDDGKGISAEILRKKAVEKGILTKNQILSDAEAVNLIFHPGFSTKSEVTEVSGRGVGMDVVKTNIEKISGEIVIETHVNQGSTFNIILPLTLAIIDGLVVTCESERFVVPLSQVHESVRLNMKDLKATAGIGDVLHLRGEYLPVFPLSNFVKGRSKKPSLSSTPNQIAIIVRTHSKGFAVLVDDVVGQYQVVTKKLGAEVENIKGFSGSAILSDGRPALILELADLINNPSVFSNQSSRVGRSLGV